MERSDPLHPQLFTLQDEYRKLLVDNPDVHYPSACSTTRAPTGSSGTGASAPTSGMTFGTAFGQGQVGGRTGTQTQTHIDEFELGPNGEVDILIAPAVGDARPAAEELGRPRAGHGAAGHPGDPLREVARATSRGCGWSWCPSRARWCRRRSSRARSSRPSSSSPAMFLTFVGGTALQMWHDAGEQHEHVRRDRPGPSTWPPRTTRCARTPTPR